MQKKEQAWFMKGEMTVTQCLKHSTTSNTRFNFSAKSSNSIQKYSRVKRTPCLNNYSKVTAGAWQR